MLRSIQRLLTASRFAVEAFASAEAFLDRNQDSQLACLVLDIRLAGMSGLDLRRRLTAAGSSLPVIFITASGDENLKAAAISLHCAAYLQKPFPPEALIAAVTSALRDR
ncbi:response regulator [Ensifer sp. IC3342]|nr:response regulator [Ensifer sp. BRP08]MCA1448651.1 response regulator [Ensifer sp. IC3342]